MLHGRWRRRTSGVSDIIAAILLTGITVVAGVFLWLFVIPTPVNQPTVDYTAVSGVTYPVWGDPTDCFPNLPNSPTYYLGNGTHDPRYSTYMNAWTNDCQNANNGTYNQMNVTEIVFTQISQVVPLVNIQFNFLCHNETPAPMTTFLVRGSLAAMSWFPGSSQSLSLNAPKLGSCGTFNASGFGGGVNGVYYNRLGFFKPLATNENLLLPGSSFVLYIHTYNSVREAPSPLEGQLSWYKNDIDDFHGAPTWCFTTPGACTIDLVDTAISTQPIIASIPVYNIHQ